MNDKDNKFINAINTIITNFENIKFVQSNNIESLISSCKLIENDINKIKSDNRLLKIGIIGKMKAGKSSFVNALLFDGNNILPTAATPKTANLTRINFGEKEYIKVTFYNEDEWKNIEDKAYKFKSIKEEENKIQAKDDEMYNQNLINPNTPFYKELESSYEIYNMIFTKNRKGILDKLGKEEILGENEASAIGEIMNAYVGEDGIYTPIVKNVEVYIKVNDEDLKDIQIVDTPGLDDTVLSRSLVTEIFLSECHVVFVLSQSSSFLDASDMQLII
ncbi:dynamin family protein [Brachyspira pilosicoli]|nr:dynamin family protein [Brachyspira pilosicoli]